jgi:hypothetical protein
MPKWFAVRVSAVLAILGSLLTLLIAVWMASTGARSAQLPTPPDSPFPIKAVMFGMSACFAAFSLWGLATALAVFRRRSWARLSMIIFAVLLVGMGGSALVGIAFIRMPETPNVAPGAMQYARISIALFYAALTVIGAWWLLLFNSSATRQYFAGETPESPAGRPLSISIIGWYLLLCSPVTAIGAIQQAPAMFFGAMVTGWAAMAVFTLFTAVQIYLGTGLLRLEEPARLASLAYIGFAAANLLLTVLLPGFAARMQVMMQHMPSWMRAGQTQTNLESVAPLMLCGTLVVIFPVWFLIRRRSAFHP